MSSELKGNQRHGINQIAFSYDGTMSAVSDVDMWVEVRRGTSLLFEREFSSRQDKVRTMQRVHSLAFSHDGTRLYVAAADRVSAVAIPTGDTVWSYQPPRYWGFLVLSPTAVATSPGGLVASAFENGVLTVWDAGGHIRNRWHSSDCPRLVGFLPDGDRLVGTDSFTLTRWMAESGELLARVRLEDRAYGLAVAAHAPVVGTRGVRWVTIWDADRLEPIARIPSPKGLPSLAFHPDEPEFAVPSIGSVTVYGFDGSLKRELAVRNTRVVSIAYSPSGGTLTVGCSDRTVREL